MPSIFHTWQKPVKHLLFVANISCFGKNVEEEKRKPSSAISQKNVKNCHKHNVHDMDTRHKWSTRTLK